MSKKHKGVSTRGFFSGNDAAFVITHMTCKGCDGVFFVFQDSVKRVVDCPFGCDSRIAPEISS